MFGLLVEGGVCIRLGGPGDKDKDPSGATGDPLPQTHGNMNTLLIPSPKRVEFFDITVPTSVSV